MLPRCMLVCACVWYSPVYCQNSTCGYTRCLRNACNPRLINLSGHQNAAAAADCYWKMSNTSGCLGRWWWWWNIDLYSIAHRHKISNALLLLLVYCLRDKKKQSDYGVHYLRMYICGCQNCATNMQPLSWKSYVDCPHFRYCYYRYSACLAAVMCSSRSGDIWWAGVCRKTYSIPSPCHHCQCRIWHCQVSFVRFLQMLAIFVALFHSLQW